MINMTAPVICVCCCTRITAGNRHRNTVREELYALLTPVKRGFIYHKKDHDKASGMIYAGGKGVR